MELVHALEQLLEKAKQDPAKDQEELTLRVKTLEAQNEVLDKKYKLAQDYIQALEEQNNILRKSQCSCGDGCDCSMEACSKPTSVWDAFWNYFVWGFLLWMVLSIISPRCSFIY